MCSACSGDYENPDMTTPEQDPLDAALQLVHEADQRNRRSRELTDILMENLGYNPFRP